MIFTRRRYAGKFLSPLLSLEFSGCIILAFLFVFFQYLLCLYSGKANLQLDIITAASGNLKVYWRSGAGSYSEKKSVTVKIKPGGHHYDLVIPALPSFSLLRIDPLDGPGEMTIRQMVISQPMYLAEYFDFDRYLRNKPEVMGFSAFTFTALSGLSCRTDGKDPWFIVRPLKKIDLLLLLQWLLAAVAGALLLFFVLNQRFLKGSRAIGILQVEISASPATGGLRWLEALEGFFPGLILIKVIETEQVRNYSFRVNWPGSADFSALVEALHREHPGVRNIRLQLPRSGEV
jgi:hypothetical protein